MPNVTKSIRVRYNDGDVEDVTRDDLYTISDKGSIGIREIGFRFIKKVWHILLLRCVFKYPVE